MENTEQGEDAPKLLNDFEEIAFLEIALVILGTWIAVVAIRRILPLLAEHGPGRARLYLLGAVPIARLALMVGAILWILPIVFNVTFQNFLVVAGAVSVAIGFAFKDYVSSLVAGVVAVFERPYRPGDWVEIDGDYGEVATVGLRAIRVVTASDDVVTIAHGRIWEENVSNANDGERTLMCVTTFHLAPDHDAMAARAALRDVALTSAYLLWERPVQVIVTEQPWATRYEVKAYPFEMRDQFRFVSDVTLRGRAALAALGARPVAALYAPPEEARGGTR